MKRILFLLSIFITPQIYAYSSAETYRLLNILSDTFRYIRSEYVTPVSDETLIESAIQGMLSGLDPHSGYINQTRYQEILKDINGGYAGIGIEFSFEKDKLKIVTPLDGSPAYKAGLKPGDVIMEINATPTLGLNLFEVADRLKGQPKEAITLKIQRGDTLPFTVQLRREKIELKPVFWKIIDHIGYVRLSNFNHKQTSTLFRKSIAQIQSRLGTNLQGILIDLRNNPGGLLDQAVSIADDLIDQGLIVRVKSRKPESDQSYTATIKPKLSKDIPLIVLVNEGTASSAEILAVALKDHNRAFLMGQKTYGKGSVQTIIPIPPGYTAIRLTTGYYYAPSGKKIQGTGVEPHEVLSKDLSEQEVLQLAVNTLYSLAKRSS